MDKELLASNSSADDRLVAAAVQEVYQKLGELQHPEPLILLTHASHGVMSRRMWNVAAVEAALKLHFPRTHGYHVITWDVALPGPAASAASARLYSAARVVVTGAGLAHVHHVLLQPGAAVVDVETRGVTWHQVEPHPVVMG